ncbi:MAG: hypothetical protein NZ742_02250 [Acidobacteria bacterium]|nr:hypothetical protein [Acidobacteriota bacterium]MDW7983667.1 hypothetical protein [Acidobacteriota bacterium]
MDLEKARRRLVEAIQKYRGRLTAADVSALLGVSVYDAADLLRQMMEQFYCRLAVTPEGVVLYEFPVPLRRRTALTLREVLDRIAQALWRAFVFLYKIWIAATLVAYFIVFTVILVMLILASAGSRRGSRRSDRGVSLDLGPLLRLLASIFEFRTYTTVTIPQTDREGYRYRKYESKKAVWPGKASKKGFVASVYDFVFGPPRVPFDPLADEKEVIAYLRKQRGILTPAELIRLAGWTLEEADNLFAYYVARFKGEARVSENGVLYGEFNEILVTGGLPEGSVVYYWDEDEPPFELTGNSIGRNLVIAGMNVFNLFFGLLFVAEAARFVELFRAYGFHPDPGLLQFWLGWIPLTYSILFFAVPLARIPVTMAREQARRRRNEHRRLVRVVFSLIEQGREAFQLEDIQAEYRRLYRPPTRPARADVDRSIQAWLPAIVRELGGVSDLTEDGRVVYRWPRIAQELAEAARLREGRPAVEVPQTFELTAEVRPPEEIG